MKKVLLVLLAVFIGYTANAQLIQSSAMMVTTKAKEHKKADVGYLCTAELDGMFNPWRQHYGIQTIQGIRIKNFYLGAGIGIGAYSFDPMRYYGTSESSDFGDTVSWEWTEDDKFTEFSAPLYLHLSYEFNRSQKKYSPYIAFKYGYDLGAEMPFMVPSIGLKVKMKDSGGLRIGVGLCIFNEVMSVSGYGDETAFAPSVNLVYMLR